MPHRKRPVKAAAHNREHHLLLLAVLYLSGVVLAINAWLVTQQLVSF